MHPRLLYPLLLVQALMLAIAGGSAGAASADPMTQVKQTVDQVVIILRDDSLDWDSKEAKVKDIVRQGFDFRSMSQSVLATNWKKATPAEQERFVEYFSQHLMDTYLKKIQSNDQEYYLRYHGQKVKGNRAVVDTSVVSGGKEIPVVYKLKDDGGRWYTYDVMIEGQSLVSSYRSVYGAMVQQEGMGGLLDNLQTSLDKYKRRQGR